MIELPPPITVLEKRICKGFFAEFVLRAAVELGVLPSEMALLPEWSATDRALTQKPLHSKLAHALALMSREATKSDTCLKRIAHVAGLSSWHLSRLLKAETGLGFRGHLRVMRLQRATDLLQYSTRSIKEIAHAVGYGNASTLARDFRTCYGQRPRAWRLHCSCSGMEHRP